MINGLDSFNLWTETSITDEQSEDQLTLFFELSTDNPAKHLKIRITGWAQNGEKRPLTTHYLFVLLPEGFRELIKGRYEDVFNAFFTMRQNITPGLGSRLWKMLDEHGVGIYATFTGVLQDIPAVWYHRRVENA